MNGEWIYFELARWILSVALVYLGYLLGIRSQKVQALREYITGIVRDEYPELFFEIKRNLEYLDNYLENPGFAFPFPKLNNFFGRGLDEFMKRHHKDLFQIVSFFQEEVLPNFRELDLHTVRTKEKIFDSWCKYLKNSLPKEVAEESKRIAEDLIKTGPHYVLPDLLNERYGEVRNKIEKCFFSKTSHIYREKTQMRHVINMQSEIVDFDEISQSLIEKAKPEIAHLIETYKELKKENDREVKEKLLPLLQKYISKPI